MTIRRPTPRCFNPHAECLWRRRYQCVCTRFTVWCVQNRMNCFVGNNLHCISFLFEGAYSIVFAICAWVLATRRSVHPVVSLAAITSYAVSTSYVILSLKRVANNFTIDEMDPNSALVYTYRPGTSVVAVNALIIVGVSRVLAQLPFFM